MITYKAKRVLAILLAAVMIVTMIPAMAFAEGKEESNGKEINLVMLGNSTSHGYGMPDHFRTKGNGFSAWNDQLETTWTYLKTQEYNAEHPDNEQGRMSNRAYPWQFKKYLEEQEGVSKVNLTPLMFNGCRTDEFRAFMDEDFYEKAKARELKYAQRWIDEHPDLEDKNPDRYCGFLKSHMGWYFGNMVDGKAIDTADWEHAHEYVESGVENADVIVFDLCNNNFGTYLGYRLSAYLGVDGNDRYLANTYETISDVDDLPEGIRTKIDEIKDKLMDLVPMPELKQLVDAVLYGTADCLANYSADIELIRQKNPDAKIIAVSVNNPLAGLKIATGDTEIDIGKLTDGLFELVNLYIRMLDKNAEYVYFADLPDDMTTFASSLEKAKNLRDVLSDGMTEKEILEVVTDPEKTPEELFNVLGEARSKYAITQMFDQFNSDYLHIPAFEFDNDPYTGGETLYKTMIAPGFAQNGVALNDLSNMEDKDIITGDATVYVTYDTSQADPAKAISYDLFGDKHGVAPTGQDTVIYLTEGALITNAGGNVEAAKGLYETAVVPAFEQQGVTLPDWDSEDFTKVISAPITVYVTFDFNQADFSKAISFDLYGNLHPVGLIDKLKEDDENVDMTVYLTKSNVADTATRVYQLLLDSAKFNRLDINSLIKGMKDPSSLTGDIVQYVFGGKNSASDGTKALICILERYLMASGLGEHPNAEGCDQKFEAVKEAYLKEETDIHIIKEELRERIEELREKIEELKEHMKEAISGKSIRELVEELETIYDEAKKIGIAIYKLPDYTDMVDSYANILGLLQETTFILEDKVKALEITSEEMRGQISDLEEQLDTYKQEAGKNDDLIAKLTAKAIRVDIKTKVTFPAGKVKIAVSWDKDNDAAGYTFKVNGVVTEPTATETGFIYEDNAANVGATYSFEVRPYILYKEGKIEGRNYKATVVPKVKLSKGAITSLKKGTKSFTVKWKKVSGASGYQVSYKVGKKTSKKIVNGGKKTSLKVTNLKSGKKYTVKVRAWKTVNGKKYYGKWSNAKKVTVK